MVAMYFVGQSLRNLKRNGEVRIWLFQWMAKYGNFKQKKQQKNSKSKVWPNAVLKGCNFHYGDALYRKIHQLNIRPFYRQNPGIYIWLRRIFALCMAPPEVIPDLWQYLSVPPIPEPALIAFVEYYRTTWLFSETRYIQVKSEWESCSKNLSKTD